MVKKTTTAPRMETVPITSIKPHPRNVRKHSKANLDAIAKSLQEFGQTKPLVLDVESQIIAGNGTYAAICSLGWKTVHVVRTGLRGLQAEAYAIADNKTTDLSEFDYEKLVPVLMELQKEGAELSATGFSNFELQPLIDANWIPAETEEQKAVGAYKTIHFTKEEWELVRPALGKCQKEQAGKFEVATESSALSVIAYLYSEGGNGG